MRDSCKGCIYYRHSSSTQKNTYKICHYLLDTNEKRPCPAENCTVKKTDGHKQKSKAMKVKI